MPKVFPLLLVALLSLAGCVATPGDQVPPHVLAPGDQSAQTDERQPLSELNDSIAPIVSGSPVVFYRDTSANSWTTLEEYRYSCYLDLQEDLFLLLNRPFLTWSTDEIPDHPGSGVVIQDTDSQLSVLFPQDDMEPDVVFMNPVGQAVGAYSCRYEYSLEETQWKHDMLSLYSEGEIQSKPLTIHTDHANSLATDEITRAFAEAYCQRYLSLSRHNLNAVDAMQLSEIEDAVFRGTGDLVCSITVLASPVYFDEPGWWAGNTTDVDGMPGWIQYHREVQLVYSEEAGGWILANIGTGGIRSQV